MSKKIKVFIVEDSILMQKILIDILSADEGIEIVGKTNYGKEALEKIPQLQPDVVTLDVHLPDINGLKVLEQLMMNSPVRAIMLSAYTQRGAEITMKALELGALDFIPKPSGEVSLDLYNFSEEIISKVKMVATVDLRKPAVVKRTITPSEKDLSVEKLVVIGSSTGGPAVIMEIMKDIPKDINAAFLIVQHMPVGFIRSFAERIAWHSGLKTKEAEDGEAIIKGAAYLAPSGYHMVIERAAQGKNRYVIRLDETPLVNYVRPAADVTMASVAETFQGSVVGVVLTGMGKDGMDGSRKFKAKGWKIIAQSEETCSVYGMPKAVVDNKLADVVLPPDAIAKKITEYVNHG